jgi:hypothetical protein
MLNFGKPLCFSAAFNPGTGNDLMFKESKFSAHRPFVPPFAS